MGIKPFRSLTSGRIFSSNNMLSVSIDEKSQIMRYADLYQSRQDISIPQFIAYRSSQHINQTHILRQRIYCNSADQFDNLNQYIFLYLLVKTAQKIIHPILISLTCTLLSKFDNIPKDFVNNNSKFNYIFHYINTHCFHNCRRGKIEIKIFMNPKYGIQCQLSQMVSGNFRELNVIKFNSLGYIKIANAMQSPRRFQGLRNQRFYWGQKNLINYFVQQTYRFGLVLLQLCSMSPISLILSKNTQKHPQLYQLQQTFGSFQYQLTKALQIVKQRYSQLLNNLINIMLCHPRDRPLPSQIYQVLSPYKTQILQFKPFNFNAQTIQMIKSNLNTSNYSRRGSFSADKLDNNNTNSQQNSLQLPQRNMYSSLNDNNNKNSIYVHEQYTQLKQQQYQHTYKESKQNNNKQYNNLSVLQVNNLPLHNKNSAKNSLIYNIPLNCQSIMQSNTKNNNVDNNNYYNVNNSNSNNFNSANYSILDNNNNNNTNNSMVNNIYNNINNNLANRYRTNTSIQFYKNRQRNRQYINTKQQNFHYDKDREKTNINTRNYSLSSRNQNMAYIRNKTIQNGYPTNYQQTNSNLHAHNRNNSYTNIDASSSNNANRNRALVRYNSQEKFHNLNGIHNQKQIIYQKQRPSAIQTAQQNLLVVGRAAQSSVYNPQEFMNMGRTYQNTGNIPTYAIPVQIKQNGLQHQQYQPAKVSRSPTYLSH